MNPVSFLIPAPGAQRSAIAPVTAPGQFGDVLSSLLGAGGITPEVGALATPEGVSGEPDAGTEEQTTGTQLPVPGFVLPDDYRPIASAVSGESDAAVDESPETATTVPGAPGAGFAAPEVTRQPTASVIPTEQLPVAPQQPSQQEDWTMQKPADGAEHATVAAAQAGPAPAGFAVAVRPQPTAATPVEASEQPRVATGALPAATVANQAQLALQTPAVSLVPTVAVAAGEPVSTVYRPLLIPVGESASGTAPLGLAAGSVQLEPTTPAAPTLATAAVRTPHAEPLHRQLAGPLLMLATGPHGERTLSIQVAPEALGPITVKAVLGAEGLRVELTAPGEAGREALRTMLPELRRELAATGAGTVHIGSAPDPGGSGTGQAPGGAGHFGAGRQDPGSAAAARSDSIPDGPAQLPEPAPPATTTTRSTGLDVLA